ncbi:response regulator [Lysobacter capsici]|uniref:response regulator n=1 Tax=Lysobacter capsici TaxID=435897 RepID=UPI00398D3EF9
MSISALSVLVVEDHGFQRRMALRLLSELGVARAFEAADGASALRLLEAMTQPPDVVMVDLDMPGMDGIEFIDHLAQRHLARAVLVVSALDAALLHTVQTMARACGLRVLDAVAKPLTKAKLATAWAACAKPRPTWRKTRPARSPPRPSAPPWPAATSCRGSSRRWS